MRAALILEAIGDDTATVFRAIRRGSPTLHWTLGKTPFSEPWVARIVGADSKFGLSREFLRGQKDYRRANSVGSRGVMVTFWLESGNVYEVCHRTSWRQVRRYFCRVDADGERIAMTENEVLACLENDPSASMF